MTNDKRLLGTAPVGKLLFKLAVPTVLAQLINMLYNIVDRIYIGHMPQNGDLALTGVGVAMPIILIVSAFATLVGSGGAPRASIFMGQKDNESAEKTLGTCLALQLLLSAVLTLVLLLWNRELLFWFGASENTVIYAVDYLKIYALGTLFVQLTLGMNAFITAQGFTKASMLTVTVGAVSNIILDPIFIYGFGMGVKGAALATVISQAISAVWVMLFLFSSKSLLRIRLSHIRFNPKFLIPCVGLGLATFIMTSSDSIITGCFNTSLRKYGGDVAVGAMTILSSVMQFAMLPLSGIAQGAQPILSYNYGARNAERVKKTFRLLLLTCITYSVLLWSAIMLFPGAFVSLFTTKPELAAFAKGVIRIYLGAVFLFGIQIACQMTFVSLGKAASSVSVAIMRKFVLLLPLIYLLPLFILNKTTAVYMAEPIADVIAVTYTSILFYFQFRKALRQIS